MRLSRLLFFVLTLLQITTIQWTIYAQEEEEVPRKFFFGGNFELMFGTVTNINVSPLVGYRITPRLSAGVGATYQYYREKLSNADIFNTYMYGGRTFLSLDVIKDLSKFAGLKSPGTILAYSEYEALNWNYYDRESRIWLNNVYFGGGLRMPVGERSAIQILVLWNANQTFDSPYSNPIIRFGFQF